MVADGRNALARSAPRFDVIEMDALFPSSPFSGNLYSVEFFRLCASRLRPGGLMCAWSPKPRVTATFMAAFRHVIEMRQGQLLVGSNEPIEIAVDAWRARAASPEVVSYLGANNARKLAEALEHGARSRSRSPSTRATSTTTCFPATSSRSARTTRDAGYGAYSRRPKVTVRKTLISCRLTGAVGQ